MKTFENNAYFWQKIDTLLLASNFHVEFKAGEAHAKHPSLIYPLDFGRIKDFDKSECMAIPFYKGSLGEECNAIVVSVDILAKEISVNVLLGCDGEEEIEVLRFLNQTDFQKTLLIRRGDDIPSWAISDN